MLRKPKKWLLVVDSVEKIGTSQQEQFRQFEKARKNKEDATARSLRYSFATHLLESGVDFRYIEKKIEGYIAEYQKKHGITFEEMLKMEESQERKPDPWVLKLNDVEKYKDKWEVIIDLLR